MITYKEIYEHLASYLSSEAVADLFTDVGLNPIAHIDLYKHQPKREDTEVAYPTPAVFLEFAGSSDIEYRETIANWTEQILLHFEVRSFEPTAHDNSLQNLDHLEAFGLLERAMIAYTTAEGLPIKIVQRQLNKDANNHPVYVIKLILSYNLRTNCL